MTGTSVARLPVDVDPLRLIPVIIVEVGQTVLRTRVGEAG